MTVILTTMMMMMMMKKLMNESYFEYLFVGLKLFLIAELEL